MKKILGYTRNHKLLTFIGTISMIILIAADLILPQATSKFVDEVLTKGRYEILKEIILVVGIITAIKFVFGYVKEYLFDVLSAKVAIELKDSLFDHIETLSFSYFDKVNTGELMSRIGEDVDNIWNVISYGLRLFIENIVYFVFAGILLLRISVPLTLISLVPIPLIAVLALKLDKKLDDIFGKISDETAELNTTAQENIAGVKLVKAFAREKHEILKFLSFNQKYYDLKMEHAGIWGKFFPLEEFLSNLSVVVVTCFGGILAIQGKITVGQLIAFSSYLWMVIWPMRDLGWVINVVSQAKTSAGKIEKILNTKPTVCSKENPIMLKEVKGHINYKNVSFSYGEKNVLEDINIDIKQGSTVAVMGTTGAGKSTFTSLIGRNYDITHGRITVDGVDIRDMDLNQLRSSISIVMQDSFLFSDTIESNLGYGNREASMEEIKEAVRLACADEFVDSLEEGYDTLIGERGLGLSGGQKQRLCIARALLKKAPILILDDSTSALDMETEYELLKHLYDDKQKRTTFIIAHRISAVKNADMILYMENGRVVECGNHEELIAKKGKYFEIYKTQFKDFIDDEEKEVG